MTHVWLGSGRELVEDVFQLGNGSFQFHGAVDVTTPALEETGELGRFAPWENQFNDDVTIETIQASNVFLCCGNTECLQAGMHQAANPHIHLLVRGTDDTDSVLI